MTEQEQTDFDELEAILFKIEGTTYPVTNGFYIDSADKASWAGRKIVQAEDRIADQKSVAEEYKHRIDEWFERTIREDQASIEYLRNMIRPFAISEIHNLKKGKTLKYFGVSISMRKLPDKAEILDEGMVIDYCEEYLPDAVEIRKSLSRTEVKKALLKGYDIPGASIIQGSEELYISGEKISRDRSIKSVA